MMNIFNVIIILTMVSALFGFFHISKKTDWKETNGVISKLEVKEKYNRHKETNGFSYIVELEYNYTVDGITYLGNSIYRGLPNEFKKEHLLNNFLEEYKNKKEVKIYYDSQDHTISVLKNYNMTALQKTVFLIFFLSVGYGMYFVYNKFFM